MYSDTHFHFQMMTEERQQDGAAILSAMAARNCFFGMDIGTAADDLPGRQACADKTIASISDRMAADRCRSFLHFSAGIWPSIEEIKNRRARIEILKKCVEETAARGDHDILNRRITAVGECGLDHHWNPSGADGRCESDFNAEIYRGERELFEMQLEYAKELRLPVIIHSRDAFEDTLECIKNIGYDNGIIHCFSYGKREAEAFLERGWYISFSGSVTYTKKSRMECLSDLLRCVPDDKILCETDAPYLAPVPMRGQTNTPVLVEHVYDFTAKIRGVSTEQLCGTVDNNIKRLFNLTV